VIADLHAHYPMHLRPKVRGSIVKLVASAPGRWRTLDAIRSFLIRAVSRVGNYQRYDSGPRVTVPLLHGGGVGVAMSVLYSPFDEMDLGKRYGSPPDGTYFPTLLRQLEDVEAEVEAEHPGRARIVHDPDELERTIALGEVALIHCVEGGFHLGPTPDAIDAAVSELAGRGCFYITLAHLFYRSVATNANAIPFIPGRVYRRLFPMPEGTGLTDLGRAAVGAMIRERVIVDITHMDEAAIDETFALLDQLDPQREAPVIASHAGYRFGADRYNLSAETIERVAERDGIVGLILATHQAADGLGHPDRRPDSLAVVYRHVDRIREIAGSHRHTAIGTDFDGFIKPTLPGLESEGDLHRLEDALIDRYGPDDAELIASGNVLRLARSYWRGGLEENPPPQARPRVRG
jgi:microsomal dipeptidase-like Zn-dependent dipeptidase